MAEDFNSEPPNTSIDSNPEDKVVQFPPDKIEPPPPPEDGIEWRKLIAGITAAMMLFALLFTVVDPFLRHRQTIPTLRMANPTLSFYERIGQEIHDYDPMISRMKTDLGKEAVQIKVLVGPYYSYFGIIGMLRPLPGRPESFLVLVDSQFYTEITVEERRALVAHEVGHLVSFAPLLLRGRQAITLDQMIADRIAARYVPAEALIKLLDRLYYDYHMRKQALENPYAPLPGFELPSPIK